MVYWFVSMVAIGWYYLRWHYTNAIRDLVGIVLNFVWFFYNFFSIPILLRTLFVPFHRLSEAPRKRFDPVAWVQAAIINSLMRVVGAVLRLTLIFVGGVLMASAAVVGGAFFCVWLLAPLAVTLLIGLGLTFLIAG